MKSILTNARRHDNLESLIRKPAKKVRQGQEESASGSAAQDDNTRGLDNEPDDEDETLIVTTRAPGSEECMWLIKLPGYLLDRWSAVDEDNRQLGTMRVWDMKNPETGHPYMTIYTPSEEDPKVMEEFDVTVFEVAMKNRYVFATQVDNDGESDDEGKEPNAPRAKHKVLSGKITSRATAQPTYDAAYSKRMHERYEAARPQRHIEEIDYREGIRLMIRDVSKKDVINTAIKKSKLANRPGDPKDRFTRMPHHALLDLLFVVFGEKPLWGLKDLRRRTEQPEAYLKEVLPEIAEKIVKGANKGKWQLTDAYRNALNSLPEEGGSQSSHAAKGGLDKAESVDSDENDNDMEEVC